MRSAISVCRLLCAHREESGLVTVNCDSKLVMRRVGLEEEEECRSDDKDDDDDDVICSLDRGTCTLGAAGSG